MKILQEFKDFAVKGNVVDMAVGVIIGAAFGKIVTALVSQVVMPPIGLLLGIVLKEKTDTAAAVSINYGVFINTLLDFLIVAFVIFMLVKQINRFKKEAEVTTQECPKCISSISIRATRCPCCTSELPS
mgnify:CR=1 FL=1